MGKRTRAVLVVVAGLIGLLVLLSLGSQLWVSVSEGGSSEAASLPDSETPIAPGELNEDITYFQELLDRVHPEPISAFPLTEIGPELGKLRSSLDEEMSPRKLYRRLAPRVTSLGDDHVRLHPPRGLTERYRDSDRRFPLDIRLIGGDLYVAANRAPGSNIERGARILAINGVAAEALLPRLSDYHSGTGAAQQRYHLQKHFGETLFAVYGWIGSYELRVKKPDSSAARGVTVSGIARDSQQAEPFSWERVDEKTILFTYNRFKDPEGTFAGFLEELFGTAKREGIEHLIIDLRQNEGGSSSYGDELLRYLTAEPFAQLSRSEITVSREIRDEFMGYVPGFLRWVPLQYLHPLLRPLWTKELGQTATIRFDPVEPEERPLRFTGHVTVLIGPGTMSSASLLAATIKEHDIGTLVGRPAGGYATHYGNVIETRLPNSGLPVDMPTSVNYGNSTGPITPDHRVGERVRDLVRGQDAALRFALEYEPQE